MDWAPRCVPSCGNTYDTASNLTSATDALGNSTQLVYDHRDRLTQRTDPDPDGAGPLVSPITRFVYDDANRLTQVEDPLSRSMIYAYDDLDRLVSETFPDPDGTGPLLAPILIYTYDAEDHRTSTIDALGNTTYYEFDDLYRLVRVIEPDPDGSVGPLASPVTEYSYDAEDQLVMTSDPLDRRSVFKYDTLGRVVQETFSRPRSPRDPWRLR